MSKTLTSPKNPRSAVVTGAARGIGRAIATELVGRGFQVIVTDVDAAAAEITAEEIGAAAGLALDVTDEDANHQMAARACTYAPLGAWVCNAGVGFDGTMTDLSSVQIRRLIDVNFTAVVWGSRAAAGVFRAQAAQGVKGGDIGIISSLSAHGPVPGLSVYAATKAAVLSLATSLSAELKKDKIHVHAICPDGVNTQMVADMNQGGEARALIAAGKFLQPQEVATALVEMFGTRRVYRTLPAWRGAMMRISSLAPGPMMRAVPLIRRMGERKLKKGLAS
ncbi:MAG: SDR family oxidoreductase [Kineosporiaceae bacterium]|nr:SDR family oxidoreductase [Aeromicrobium sp.]